MALSPLELFQFGGVDSRSNPLNYPPGRALRCRNWVPRDAGVLQLRYGFSTVSMTGSTSTAAIHTLLPYTLFDDSGTETPYVIIGQGSSLRALNILTDVESAPSVRGRAISGTNGWQSYLANGKIHLGNGTDQKWFDGTTFRDNGLRSLSTTESSGVAVYLSLAELTAVQRSTVSLSQTASGGTFGTQSQGGMLFYVALFNTSNNELGPSPNFVGAGRIQINAGSSKVTLTNLPAEPSNWVKLIGRTDDGTAQAGFCLTASPVAIASIVRSGATITVTTSTNHGRSTGDVVLIVNNSEPIYNFPWVITVTSPTQFTITTTLLIGATSASGGTVGPILNQAGASTASFDVTSTLRDTVFVVNDANRGVPPSTVGGPNPGYQFYAAIANPNGGGHVGNRVPIGPRLVPTVRTNVTAAQLPNLTSSDSEWEIALGRTGDGGLIPYQSSDTPGNLLYAQPGQATVLIGECGGVDGTLELPTRNGVIPAGMNMFCLSGGRVYGGIKGTPTAYKSAAEADDLTGTFVGRPEQSFAPDDIETFPTAQGLRGLFDDPRGAFYATKNDGAVLGDLSSGAGWIGPWYGAGMAGERAWTDTPYGKFWVTGHKQLATMEDGTPVAVSDEYQLALLSRIGDDFLEEVELEHLTDVEKGIDKIVINCLDSDGVPFQVYHDFRLRDQQSDGQGQGYESVFSTLLNSAFTLAKVRDADGAERLWAGASNGKIYQLEDGANDAGTEFDADAIYPINAGPNRPSVAEFRLYGDQNIAVSVARRLDASPNTSSASTASFQLLKQEAVAGEDGNSYYGYKMTATKMNKGFLRLQLSSHSADGNLDLNDPPHCPLETYGRVYLGQGLVGTAQGV